MGYGDEMYAKMCNEEFRGSFVSKLFSYLKKGLWHTTSSKGLTGILHDGFILPNNGERLFSYPQTENSYAFLHEYVALFDFESATERQCIEEHLKWATFFTRYDPLTIAIELSRENIKQWLIPPRRAEQEVDFSQMWIPYVECWSSKPIPKEAIVRCLLILSKEKSTRSIAINSERDWEKVKKVLNKTPMAKK